MEGDFARVCKVPKQKNSKLDTLEDQIASDEDPEVKNDNIHVSFASTELECLSHKKKDSKSIITIMSGKQHVRMKVATGAEATVIPYHLYKILTRKTLQKINQPLKGWFAAKPTHPKGCVRLPTQYKDRKIDLLYLVVERHFTPLLSCDACLGLELLLMNLHWLDIPDTDLDVTTQKIDEYLTIFDIKIEYYAEPTFDLFNHF